MNDPKYRRLIIYQIFLWIFFNTFFAFLYKQHFELHLDFKFLLKYFILSSIFFTINILVLIRLAKPVVEDLEVESEKKQKAIKSEKDHLENENKLFNIMFNAVNFPILVINNQMHIKFFNQKTIQFFELKNAPIGLPLIELTRNFEFQNFINNNLHASKAVKLSNFTFDNKENPNRKYFEIELIPIKFSPLYLIILQDVSDKKITDEIKEDFISNFSHEIRTPLTILNGQLQNLKLNLDNKEQLDKTILKLENNSKRLISLFDDMLNLTSIENTKKLNLEKFDIEPLIDITIQDISLKYPDKKLIINSTINSTEIWADYRLLEQVLMNLIDNAFKYSQDENVYINIHCETQNDQYVITIEDKGLGIADEKKLRIFERFYRAETSHSNSIPGTGLGLAIVKHIIQKHQGKIKVNSTQNVGTTFQISLPLSN
jgi:two-component system phosphate regulon sensor histidine kinase PhoR